MSRAPSMPLFVDAYLADTSHLSTEEHGAYLLLLMAMWRRGGSVPDDDRDNARIVGLSPAKWQRVKERLMTFLVIRGDGSLSQKRLEKEWKFIEQRSAVASENGAKGGRPSISKNNHLAKAGGFDQLKPNESPQSHTQKEPTSVPSAGSVSLASLARPKSSSRKQSYPADFEMFWKHYPTDAIMSKKEAAAVWVKLSDDDKIMAAQSVAAFNGYCAQHPNYRPVHANRYLAQRRFETLSEVQGKIDALFFAVQGTPQWSAWEKYYVATKGRRPPKDEKGGWHFPSEWPPKLAAEGATH